MHLNAVAVLRAVTFQTCQICLLRDRPGTFCMSERCDMMFRVRNLTGAAFDIYTNACNASMRIRHHRHDFAAMETHPKARKHEHDDHGDHLAITDIGGFWA